jgi:hypothetical protein
MAPIYEALKAALVERGWGIDPDARESRQGEVAEFVHPETGKRMAWLDALLAEQEREG